VKRTGCYTWLSYHPLKESVKKIPKRRDGRRRHRFSAFWLRSKCIGKTCLNLPQRASAEPLYLSYQRGGLNILPITVVADISQIVHGLGLVQSANLGQLSMAFLSNVVKKRIRRPPEPQDLANYLCGSMEGALANESPDISNIWTCLRSATRRLKSKINVSWVNEDGQMTMCLNGFVLQRVVAEYALRNSIREYYLQKL